MYGAEGLWCVKYVTALVLLGLLVFALSAADIYFATVDTTH
jgi:hypothetical protein